MPIEASPNERAGPKRYAALDTWRFIAALGVVAYHFENNFASVATTASHRLSNFGYFVDFFFVLSGFVLMHTYGSKINSVNAYRDFMQKRLARVYPLHALMTIVFAAIAIYVAMAGVKLRDPGTMDTALIAPHLLLIHAWGVGAVGLHAQPGLNFPSWSISAELFVYLLFPLLAAILIRWGARSALVLALLFAAIMEFIRIQSGLRSFTDATWDFGMLRAVPTFFAGMAIQQIVTNMPRIRISWWLPHGFMALIFAMLWFHVPIYAVLCSFVFAVGLIAAAERGRASSILQHRCCIPLGDSSYAVYLLHTAFQVATLAIARKMGWSSWPELIALGAITTILIIATSMLCYTYFENPMRRFFSRPASQWFAPKAVTTPTPSAQT